MRLNFLLAPRVRVVPGVHGIHLEVCILRYRDIAVLPILPIFFMLVSAGCYTGCSRVMNKQ